MVDYTTLEPIDPDGIMPMPPEAYEVREDDEHQSKAVGSVNTSIWLECWEAGRMLWRMRFQSLGRAAEARAWWKRNGYPGPDYLITSAPS